MINFLQNPVVIVGVNAGGIRNGMTAAWVTQVSLRPALVAVAIAPERYTHGLIQRSGSFALSVLKESQSDLARALGQSSGADGPKLARIPLIAALTGSPILAECGAYVDCRVVGSHETGDHTLFIGEVVAQKILAGGPYLPFTPSLYL